MSLHLLDELIAEAKKLFSHTDPAVPAAAQSIVAKAEAIKTEVVADAKQLGSEAVGDGKALLVEAGRDAVKVAGDATGSGSGSGAATSAK
jgi:hypothetical protein